MAVLIRLIVYPGLGAISAILLTMSLAGNFGFWAIFSGPPLLVWVLAGAVLAILQRSGRLESAYFFANLGAIVATGIVYVSLLVLAPANPADMPNFPIPVVQLALMLGGMIIGGVMGFRLPPCRLAQAKAQP